MSKEVKRYDLSTSEGGRAYIKDLFRTDLRRRDFDEYISQTLAADFACALSRHLAHFADAHEALLAERDVLLEALTQCRAELLAMIDMHNQQDEDDGSWLYDYQTVVEADAAIAKANGAQP